MKAKRYALGVMLGVIALIAPTVVWADSVTVTADLTFNTCAAATGCQETFDITYGWDNTTNALASPAVITAMGDLGSNFSANARPDPILLLLSPANANIVLYTAGDPLGDSLLLTLSETGSSLAAGSYTEVTGISAGGQFLTALDCGAGDGPICESSRITPATAGVTVSPVMATPEPGTGVLLLTLVVCGIAMRGLRKRVA